MFGGIHIGFSEEDGTFVGSYFEKVKGMFPEKFHVVPMLDDSMREGIF